MKVSKLLEIMGVLKPLRITVFFEIVKTIGGIETAENNEGLKSSGSNCFSGFRKNCR